MTSFGVLLTGFSEKKLQDILDEIEDDERAEFGAAFNVEPASVAGNINGIMADQLAELWEVAGAVYRAKDPDFSQGEALDNVSAVTGTVRDKATKSKVTLRANLAPGTILTTGRVVSVSATDDRFVTTEDVQNATGVQSNIAVKAESEQFGPVPAFDGTIDTIETPVSGWTAKAAINNANAETYALTDGQQLTMKVDGGTEQTAEFNTGEFVDISIATAAEVAAVINTETTGIAASDEAGFLRLESDTDGVGSSIEVTGGSANVALGFSTTLVAGMNDDDAVLGTNLESDPDLRISREEGIRISGAGTLEALRSKLLDVEGVTQAFVFENTSNVTDSNGLPAKSFEAVVEGATDQAIAQAVFDNKPLGIEPFRATGPTGVTVSIEDSQGIAHATKFSRPNVVRMFVDVDVTVESSAYGGGDQNAGDQQVREAIAALGDLQQIGQDVTILAFQCEPLKVAGVIDAPVIKVEDTFPPTNTANIPIAFRDLASFDSGDVRVFVTVA